MATFITQYLTVPFLARSKILMIPSPLFWMQDVFIRVNTWKGISRKNSLERRRIKKINKNI